MLSVEKGEGMKLELVEKTEPYNKGVYEKTELMMKGLATYESGNHERFVAHAFTSMYGAIHMSLTVYHPISLSDTQVNVTLNKAAFDKVGIEYNDMDKVVPMLVDHATRKRYDGVLTDKCVGVLFEID